MKILKKLLPILFVLIFFMLNFSFVFAAKSGGTGISDPKLCDSSQENCLDNPIGIDSIPELIGRVINAVLGLVGSIALLMFIYGGIVWMTSQGNEQKVQKGKDILIWATIGLIVIFTSYALTNFIIGSIAG